MNKKRPKHAAHRKLSKSKTTSKSSKNTLIFLIVIIMIVAAAYYMLSKDNVAATVNGEKIYEKRVDAIYNSLPSGSKIPKAQLLQQIIDMKILADYIEKQGYGLSDAAFNSELNKLLSAQNEPMDQFKKNIALWGVTLEDYKESMEISIFIRGVLENNAEAVANIIEKEKKTSDVVIYSKY